MYVLRLALLLCAGAAWGNSYLETSGTEREVEARRVCAEFLTFTQRWSAFSQVYDNVNRRYPENAPARALAIRRELPFVYSRKAIAADLRPGGERSKNVRGRRRHETFQVPDTLFGMVDKQVYSDIRVIPDRQFNSLRFASLADVTSNELEEYEFHGGTLLLRKFDFRPHRSAKLTVDFSAGLTGLISQSGRVFKQLEVMNSRNPESFIRKWVGENWVDVASVAIDKPFHGSGPFDPALRSLRATLDWRAGYFDSLRSAGIPLVSGSRSGESIPLAQVNFENPGLLAGMIWMGPMHPEAGYVEAIEGYVKTNVETLRNFEQKNVEAEPVILTQSFDWFTSIRDELVAAPNAWWRDASPLGSTPLLILVGEKDPEVPLATRAYYREMARRFPHQIFYVEIKGASHDVFAITEDTYGNTRGYSREAGERAAKAWDYVYWFLRTKVLREIDVAPPAHGFLQH